MRLATVGCQACVVGTSVCGSILLCACRENYAVVQGVGCRYPTPTQFFSRELVGWQGALASAVPLCCSVPLQAGLLFVQHCWPSMAAVHSEWSSLQQSWKHVQGGVTVESMHCDAAVLHGLRARQELCCLALD